MNPPTYTSPSTQPTAIPTTGRDSELIYLRAQAFISLTAALHILNSSTNLADSDALSRALARAMRATTALKRSCAALKGDAA